MRSTHANVMFPGIGVGGYCLTKDPLLASWSRQNLFDGAEGLKWNEQSVSVNDQMPRFAFEFLKQNYPESLSGKRVLLLGVSYRGDVGDTRYTPVEPLFRYLSDSGAEVRVHDPYVGYWPELDLKVDSEIKSHLGWNPDVIILSAGHTIYRESDFIRRLADLPAGFVFDTIGLWNEGQLVELKSKHQILVLGRGDL